MLRTTSTAIAILTAFGLGLSGSALAGDKVGMKDKDASYSGKDMSEMTFDDFAMAHPGKLEGKSVMSGHTGNTLGEIEKLVRSREDDALYVVVDAEDYLEGEDDAAVLLENFEWEDENIVLMSQDPDLPLGTVTYDEVKFRDFRYTDSGEDSMTD